MQQSLAMNRKFGVIQLRRGSGYAIMLALLPVIMMYKVPFVNVGLSTALIAVSMIYAGMLILTNLSIIKFSFLMPIYLYIIWSIARSDGDVQSILLCIAIVVHLTAISTGTLDVLTLKKVIVGISCIAAFSVIFQQVFHTMFSVHIPMIASDFILDNMTEYIPRINLGGIGGEYRPSAFYLEPAHFSQYCFVGISLCLLDEEQKSIKKAAFVSLGIICTTSGMGIGIVVAVWGYYFLLRIKTASFSKKVKLILTYTILSLIVVVIALQSSTVQYTLSRIFIGNKDGLTAIDGRLFWWKKYISPLSIKQVVFGLGTSHMPDVFFTGIMKIIYCYGVVNVILYYLSLLHYFKMKNTTVQIVSLIIGILVIVADISGFIMMIFYFGIMTALLPKGVRD